jgi:hypothetical protein
MVGVVMLSGCALVQPDIIHTIPTENMTPSYDGNERNSGILSAEPYGFKVTPNFVKRFKVMADKYSSRFTVTPDVDKHVTKTADGNYIIDRQGMVMFLDMNQWEKSGIR